VFDWLMPAVGRLTVSQFAVSQQTLGIEGEREKTMSLADSLKKPL